MEYAKPEVTLLGRAATAVQLQLGKITYTPPDNEPHSTKFTVSAYEADE